MRQILRIKIPKRIETLIVERVTTIQAPWRYKIKGVAGMGYDMSYSAHSTWEKLKQWAERNGAEALLIQDCYREIAQERLKELQQGRSRYSINKHLQKGQSKGYLIVEITDPVSFVMDKLFEEAKQKVS